MSAAAVVCPLCGTLTVQSAASAPWMADGIAWCGFCEGDRAIDAWLDANPDVADFLPGGAA